MVKVYGQELKFAETIVQISTKVTMTMEAHNQQATILFQVQATHCLFLICDVQLKL